jgi:hypothetical protein
VQPSLKTVQTRDGVEHSLYRLRGQISGVPALMLTLSTDPWWGRYIGMERSITLYITSSKTHILNIYHVDVIGIAQSYLTNRFGGLAR